MSKVLYPGSFDPITKGHMNIIEQASNLFDEVVIAVLKNPSKKNYLFTFEERVEIIKEVIKNITEKELGFLVTFLKAKELYRKVNNIKVVTGNTATIDLALLHECKAIIRGLRSISDFDYEIGLSQINRELTNNEINTICLFADKNYQFVSSSMVKEVFSLNKDISAYVHPLVEEKMLIKRRILTK